MVRNPVFVAAFQASVYPKPRMNAHCHRASQASRGCHSHGRLQMSEAGLRITNLECQHGPRTVKGGEVVGLKPSLRYGRGQLVGKSCLLSLASQIAQCCGYANSPYANGGVLS